MTTIGNRLKKIRKTLNLSQEEFGKKVGLTRGAIASVEADTNKFSQDVLTCLLRTFDININYLLDGRGAPFVSFKENNINQQILNEVSDILKKYGIK